MRKVFLNRISCAFTKIGLVHKSKTKLIYFLVNSLLTIASKKFQKWKINTRKVATESIIASKLALINFKEFQKFKLFELVTDYRKIREIIQKKFFFRWTIYKPLQIVAETVKKAGNKESKRLQKLKKQKEKHENASQEAVIKENIIDMLIKILNTK